MRILRQMVCPPMIWGAVLGIVIFWGLSGIQEAMFHRGPGTIVYERDVAKRVDEDEYRRHHVVMGFVVVGIGLMLWYYAAGAYNKLANPDKKANNTAT